MTTIMSKTNGALRGAMLAATVTVSLGAVTVASSATAEAAPFRHMGGHMGHMGGFGHHWNPRWGHGPVVFHHGGWNHGWHHTWREGWGWRHGWGWRGGYSAGGFAYGVGRPYAAYGGRLCPIGFHLVPGLGCRHNGWAVYHPVRIVHPYVVGRPVFYGAHGWSWRGVHRFGYGFGHHFGGFEHRFIHPGFGHPGFGHPHFGHPGFGGHGVRFIRHR